MSIKAIRGFKDILPDEVIIWQRVESVATRVLGNFGFKEIRIPVVEKTELFARSIGEDTDIVEKEMFTFPDRHGDHLTLRPEATAGLLRSVIEHNLAGDGRPLKLYFIGPMFRYERPQKGRQRQFHQMDVEVLNDPSAHADAEIIILLDHFLRELGLGHVAVNVNSLGCRACRPGYKDKLQEYLKDRREGLCPDCRRRLENNPLRVIDCKVPGCRELVRDAPIILDGLCDECRVHFDVVRQDLTAAGVSHVINPRLVRGLDYYTRTTFEALAGELGAQNAVAGGGRYDNLALDLGGADIPATGFALGLERLTMLLADRLKAEAPGPDLFVAFLDGDAARSGFGLVQELRRKGFYIETEYAAASLKSRMKRADKLMAERVLIIGSEELKSRNAVLRNMKTKAQQPVSLDRAAEELTAILGKGEAS